CRLLARTLSTCSTKAVKPRLALVFAFAPIRDDQALMLETVERGIEGPLGDLQGLSRNLLDPQQHTVTVERPQGNSLENEHVQEPGQKLCRVIHFDALLARLGES